MVSDEPNSPAPPAAPTVAADVGGNEKPASASPQVSTAAPAEDEPLPDYEALTPELLEDECLRGDIMLRWGTLLLALLLGWTYITETNVLLQVRSGEYLAGHGLLPPRTDPFGATTEGRPWINLAWLGDLILGVMAKGGTAMLTIYGAAISFCAFQFLTRTNIPRVTTWWGSICAGLAAIALFPRLQPGTFAMTILGLAILMWLLQRWRDDPRRVPVWSLPLLFVLWSNVDPQAFLGLIVLAAFSVGTLLTGAPDRPAGTPSGIRELWLQTALSVVAAMIHPWHWHALESGWVQLAIVPEETRIYGSISEFGTADGFSYLHPQFWQSPNAFKMAALALTVLAFLAQALNIYRFDGGLCLAWMAAVGCGAASGSLFYCSSLVSAVVATLAGQEWYRANFSMAYSIDTWTVLYSRLGRAVTVLCGFALAYVSVNGMLMGDGGRRVGLGLDPRWQDRLDSLQSLAVDDAFDDRSFPFRVEQGDLLLWLGQKPFVDSRLAMYAHGGDNLLQLHRNVRQSIVGAESAGVDWKETLTKYQTNSAVARLWGPNPDYESFPRLLRNPDWSLTQLDAAGAVFHRTDTRNADLDKYIAEHQALDFVEQALRDGDNPSLVVDRLATPRQRGDYDRWLYQPLPRRIPATDLSNHYLLIAQAFLEQGNLQQATALSILALREARNALAEDPNQVDAWRAISPAQSVLLGIETQLLQQSPVTLPIRNMIILAANTQAAAASNDDPLDLRQLVDLHVRENMGDVALEYLKRLEVRLGGRLTLLTPGTEQAQEQETQLRDAMQQLQKARDDMAASLVTRDVKKEGVLAIAAEAAQNGSPLTAIELIERDLTVLSTDPALTMLYGTLLLNVGRIEEGWQQIEGMERMLPQPPVPLEMASIVGEWCRLGALANVAVGSLPRAGQLLGQQADLRNQLAMQGVFQHPFSAAGAPDQHALWALANTQTAVTAAVDFPEAWAGIQYQRAMLHLEEGSVDDGEKVLRELLRVHPNWSQRILAVYALMLITGEELSVEPPIDEIPVTPDIFAPEEPAAETSAPAAP